MATKSASRSEPTSARTVPKKVTRPAQRAARPRSVLKRPATPQQRQSTPLASSATSAQVSKQARLIALLQSEPGATISQMRSLTGWQAHTVRGTTTRTSRPARMAAAIASSSTPKGASLLRG
jgi:hypothetical protein